ncbi:hypothetical protein A1O1_05158 [Capronia coronata CBS 617.96]|uniref:WSC domain-containing protein n=1 Tax=Capronia coronata CBS 617.96 TaxID=1182541 RepID=W9Y6R5_9EURO|nr:uncharacterized protein A1O1_05158 [Capronia coronata CBS 617.96]EXJ88228.1 hypothetical protein A1O1_05158 [Capronia coronata CBS 617.96]
MHLLLFHYLQSLVNLVIFLDLLFIQNVNALASADTITWGGSNDRSGYQNNHNMDPTVVGSAQFGLLFKTKLPGTYSINGQNVPEQIFSQPLVYTGSDGVQYLYVATTQNNLYKIVAKTGVIVASRNIHRPFLDTWYLTSKTYIDQSLNGATGRPNGRYYIHAISTVDLSERPKFPVNLEGVVARNNPQRSFNGGIHHQRPALLHTGNFVYAGFASHCVQWNFTGWIVGWDKGTGQLVERFATEGAGVGPATPGAGVWMSGGGLATDGKGSMFFATGNGYASQLNGIPVNGRNPPTYLEEAAVHMAINDDGSLTVVDFFMPSRNIALGITPSQFSCGDIKRMGVVTGKSGKTYWLNLDNLGGYQNGPNKLDNVIQVYQNENSVYAGAGVYPLEEVYIYINVIQYQTHVFKFPCNNGVPYFNKMTSLNDQPGSGLVWTSDVEGSNLRIYNAVPSNGVLQEINSFVTPGTTKFTRPVFGDGIVYQGTTVGYIYAYGAPVNLPLNCTTLQFGTVNLNATTAPMSVKCTANTAVTVTGAGLWGNPNFATFTPQTVGPLSSSVILNTTQQAAGFSINTPVQLKGTGQSQAPLLMVTSNTVSWNGVITGQQVGGVNQSVIINNLGNSVLSITNILYSVVGETGPWITPNGTQAATVVSAFTFYNMPLSVGPNSAVTVPINFNPPSSGNYGVFVQIVSNGGTKVFDVLATCSDEPKAVLEFQTPSGAWVPYNSTTAFTFGNVTENTSQYLKMPLTNNGSANAAALSVTVRKPPFAIAGSIIGASNQVDLADGTLVYAGQNLTATLFCSVPKSQINVDPYVGTAQWTMNLNDPSFGKQYIQFVCNAVSEQAPPLNPITQQGVYRYAGCFTENNPGRQLQTTIYSGPLNTNEQCIAKCAAAGYIFAGTQYNQECWCGYNRPKTINDDANCDFPCTGNINEICGGNGISGTGSFISLFGDITRWNGNSTDIPGPYVNPGTLGFQALGCYTEGSQSRALNVPINSNTTVAGCLQACQGYLYSGVEYGGQCFCGNTLSTGAVSTRASDCSMTCNNNQTEYCGGPSRLNMYMYGNGSLPSSTPTSPPPPPPGNQNPTLPGPTGPAAPPTIGNFSYVSCYTEATTGRALASFALADDSISLQTCANNCTQYKYFGVEYGRECYCGNALGLGSAPATDGRCNMACSGNSSLACGGPNGLTLYMNPNWTSTTPPPTPTPSGPLVVPTVGSFQYLDCHTEATNGRALAGKAVASNDMTLQYCAGNCTGPTYFGVEYGRECYCGNTLAVGSVTATDGRCSMTCAGNSSTICGGPNGLTMYQFIVQSSSSLSSSTQKSTRTTTSSGTQLISTSTLPSTSPSTSPSISTSTSRIVNTLQSSTSLSSTSSTSSISSMTTVISASTSITTSSIQTTTKASSWSTSILLSPSTVSSVSTLTTSHSTTRSTSSSSSSSSSASASASASSTSTSTSSSSSASASSNPYYPNMYLGCAAEPSTGRLLSSSSMTNSSMTISTCLTFCSSQSLPITGLEYGRECYCASTLPVDTLLTASGCTMACGGGGSVDTGSQPQSSSGPEICGGRSRLSIYNNTAISAPSAKLVVTD